MARMGKAACRPAVRRGFSGVEMAEEVSEMISAKE